jgi:hypothetical protein
MNCRSFSRSVRGLNIVLRFLWLLLFGCAASDRVDDRNFAVDAYSPTPNEIKLAQQRAQHYWDNNSHRFAKPTRYLAVATSSISGGNIYPKLIKSETTASYFGQDSQTPSLRASCIMIYDTAANGFVSNSGYYRSIYRNVDRWLAGTLIWHGISDGEAKLERRPSFSKGLQKPSPA